MPETNRQSYGNIPKIMVTNSMCWRIAPLILIPSKEMSGTPSSWVRSSGVPKESAIGVHPLKEGEDKTVAERLREILTS